MSRSMIRPANSGELLNLQTQLNGRGSRAELVLAGTSDRVDRVVAELNTICRTATLDFALAVGRSVIEGCYRGDLQAWRLRGVKSASFRKLARHPNLPMSAASLYRCVAIFELSQRLGSTQWAHVSTSHVRVVLPLCPAEQLRLLEAAETNHWTVRRLHEEAARVRGDARFALPTRHGGRKPRPRLKRTLLALEKCIDSSHKLIGADDPCSDPSPASARSIVDLMERIKRACTTLENRVRSLLAGSKTESPPRT
jgi:hypothetical protein